MSSAFSSSILQYDFDALEPILSRQTVLHHLFQHHRDCYEGTARLVQGTALESLSLEALVHTAATKPGYRRLFALASEAWNHDLYWHSLQPGAGGPPDGVIGRAIDRSFGGFRSFLRCARAAAETLIGNGWLWVTWRAGRIETFTTSAGESPLLHGYTPLLALDLWEHAYYLDYFGARGSYVLGCFKRLINWESANERLANLRYCASKPTCALTWLGWGIPVTASESGVTIDPSPRLSPAQLRSLDGIRASR
jgi:Fe-Mn family superoxide dismutase